MVHQIGTGFRRPILTNEFYIWFNLPLELNQGRIAGWFWNKCGYWWSVSLSSWWCPVDTVSSDGTRSSSRFECFLNFIASSCDSSEDFDSLVMFGLVGGGLVVELFAVKFSSLSQLKFSLFKSTSSSSSSTFDFSSPFFSSSSFFCFWSLLSSRMSQMWNPDVGLVDVGSFMLSKNLRIY